MFGPVPKVFGMEKSGMHTERIERILTPFYEGSLSPGVHAQAPVGSWWAPSLHDHPLDEPCTSLGPEQVKQVVLILWALRQRPMSVQFWFSIIKGGNTTTLNVHMWPNTHRAISSTACTGTGQAGSTPWPGGRAHDSATALLPALIAWRHITCDLAKYIQSPLHLAHSVPTPIGVYWLRTHGHAHTLVYRYTSEADEGHYPTSTAKGHLHHVLRGLEY